jgi:mannose-6-phosphate isomerase
VQHYEWGRHGDASLVARLAAADPDSGVAIDPALPYAELWMGTHPTAPSVVLPTGERLRDWLARNPAALGSADKDRWAGDLPFLFKVP